MFFPQERFRLPVVDLRGLPEAERTARALALARDEAVRPFDLARGPLLRPTLMRLDEEDYKLFLTLHHIILDGVSIYKVFLPELAALYTAFTAGRPSPLPESPIQYADFAVWQRRWRQRDLLEGHLAYWKQQLSGSPPILELPTDRPRPAAQTFRGALRSITLSKSLIEALKALSRREGVTLFMTLVAAFKTLLYRYTGQEDILLGIASAGRKLRRKWDWRFRQSASAVPMALSFKAGGTRAWRTSPTGWASPSPDRLEVPSH